MQDYSCLTNYSSIEKHLKHFQIVDVRRSPQAAVQGAWNIAVDELKLKDFLKARDLLLLDEGFSRVRQATACATLKKAGFQSVKILIGGASQWRSAMSKNSKPVIQFVSASDFSYEFYHGQISVIAATESISSQLKTLGFSEHRLLTSNTFAGVSEVVLSSTNGGYDAAVYIGSPSDFRQLHFNQSFANLYFLEGGVGSLYNQIKRDKLIEYARTESHETSFCAKR